MSLHSIHTTNILRCVPTHKEGMNLKTHETLLFNHWVVIKKTGLTMINPSTPLYPFSG